MIDINWDKYLGFDANQAPPGMREIIFLKGSPYEMGKQYGAQAKDMIHRNFCLVAADALKNYTKEQAVERVEMLSKDITNAAPEIGEFYQGIADGAEMTYGEIALINVQLWMCIPYMMCSTIGATGSATADGKTIAGVNGDVTFNMSGYGVTLVCFPDEGNAFVTLPQLAGQFGSNFAMNEKGVIVTFDGGEAEAEGDVKFGFADFISAMVYSVWKGSSAKEANDIMKDLGVSGGWIYLFADKDKNLMITEHTSGHQKTRYPGEHGEKDYIQAANHFLDEEMRTSSIDYEINIDSYHRYNTEQKLLQDKLGELTLEYIMDILACRDSYIDGKWQKLLLGEIESNFTPEMSSPDFRTGTRCLGVAEDNAAYILHGSADRMNSYMPGSIGKFTRIPLAGSIAEVVAAMEADAVMQVWEAAARTAKAGTFTREQESNMDKARENIWAGKNHISKAYLLSMSDRPDEARKEYGLAASQFSYAYITAQLI